MKRSALVRASAAAFLLSACADKDASVAAAEDSDSVMLFFIMLESKNVAGEIIGCGDAVMGIATSAGQAKAPLRFALDRLLAMRVTTLPGTGAYNALHQTALKVDSVTIHRDSAIIGLSGKFSYGGVCDAPRIEAQLTRTATQFPTIRTASFFINGRPLRDMLSER